MKHSILITTHVRGQSVAGVSVSVHTLCVEFDTYDAACIAVDKINFPSNSNLVQTAIHLTVPFLEENLD